MTRSELAPSAAPWGTHALPEGEATTIGIGPLTLWVRAPEGEVWIAYAPGGGSRGGRADVPEAATRARERAEDDWVRWPVPEGTDAIVLSPVLGPRPVVVEPEVSFRLLPQSGARIFVRVPAWVRLRLPGAEGAVLTEVPSVLLSDTWWGDPTEGELCHWLSTTARRAVDPGVIGPHHVVCPLQLANRSEEELPVERIALRVEHLSIYAEDGRFWADETRVRYRGAEEGSEIEMAGRPPAEAPGSTRVAEPRSPIPRGLRARSFARLKALPGLGGI